VLGRVRACCCCCCSIVIPQVASDPPEVDYEAELAVVIGREAKNVKEEEAMDYVRGVGAPAVTPRFRLAVAS